MTCRKTEEINYEIVQRNVDDIVLVTDEEMEAASRWQWFEMGIAADLSGAAAMAALNKGVAGLEGMKHICVLVCGAGAEGTV